MNTSENQNEIGL